MADASICCSAQCGPLITGGKLAAIDDYIGRCYVTPNSNCDSKGDGAWLYVFSTSLYRREQTPERQSANTALMLCQLIGLQTRLPSQKEAPCIS